MPILDGNEPSEPFLDSATDLATTVIGTPYYMSPELFSNRPYGKESDVWALGCCTFEMMTRRHAFNARDLDSLAMKVLHGKAPRMPQSYSKRLTDLVVKMLSFESEERPTVSQILQQRFVRFFAISFRLSLLKPALEIG